MFIFLREKNIRHHGNKHVFKIAQDDDDDFPDNLKIKVQTNNHKQFNRKYVHQLTMLCGKADVPCIKAIAEPFRIFSLFLLKEGQIFGRNEQTANINIEQALKPVSYKELSNEIISASDAFFNNELQKFTGKRYCALLCDAGTVLKLHCFHVVLALLDKPVQSILFESYDQEPFDTNFYFNSFNDAIGKSYRTENYGALSFAPQVETLKNERSSFEFKYTPDYQGEIPQSDTLN